MNEREKAKQTETLLVGVSQRLAGRADCKNINYEVTINYQGVKMSPLIYVFPNRYKRKESDKIDIISYIHHTKLENSNLSDFVTGTYVYESSVDKKKRKWVKVK